MTDEFKREPRYIVFKVSDLGNSLKGDDIRALAREYAEYRQSKGKPPLECVVVESDWPEYEPTWAAIEARMTGSAIEAEVRAEPECPVPSCDECHERAACTQEETLAEREEVRAEAQEPVAWFAFADSNGPVPLELWGFDQKACKHAVLENARSVGWKGTVEGYLFQKGWTIRPLGFLVPQPPAPCPACKELVRSRQEVEDDLGRRNDALQAKVAEQAAEIERLTTELKIVSTMHQDCLGVMLTGQDTVMKQTERIAALDSDNKAAWATADRHMTERSEARERVAELDELVEVGRGMVATLQAKVAELSELSVTHIMLDVVPGADGMGGEIYAKSVADVERVLSAIGERNGGLASKVAEQAATIDSLNAESMTMQDTIERLEKRDRCHSKYATRPILYTDGVNGEQCCRDDLWAISTSELNEQAALIEQLRAGMWQPMDAAPDDRLVVVGWLDDEDREHPERYDFDYKEDGGWVRHADNVEHAQMVAPAGSRMPKERAPYMLWLSIPCLQAAIAAHRG